MSRLIEWERVCLVCLQKGDNRCILGDDNDSIVIADQIMKYSDILIKKETNQPKSICLQCLDDLNVASKFHRNYEESQSIIKALLNTNHQEFHIKDLWKTSSTTVNPILGICIKDEVMDNTTVDNGCENTPCLNLEDNAGTESKPNVEDRADSYIHGTTMELNNKSSHQINYKMPKRSRGRQKILSEESSSTSDNKRPLKDPRVRPKQSTGVSLKICEICNRDFRYKRDLDVHMRRHNNVQPFGCDSCDKEFVTRKELRIHVRVHTGEKPYKCQYCDLRFSRISNRRRHERKHTGEKPFKCPTCDKSFGYPEGLTSHLRTHNKFTCEEFRGEKLFQKQANCHLNRVEVNNSSEHRQTKSLDKEIFQIQENANSNGINIKHEIVEDNLIGDNFHIESTPCTDEEYGTVSRATNNEIPKQSTRVSLKICEICNRDCTTPSALVVHMRRHNNVRPFSCDHCDKTFASTGDLGRHVRVHTGEKPFKCPTCDKSFRYSQGLSKHLRTHNGEKEFICKKCGKEFTKKLHFQGHVAQHLTGNELDKSSEHEQKKRLENEIDQVGDCVNSKETKIKHEVELIEETGIQ